MKVLLLILFYYIHLTFHIIPLWNLKQSSIDLLLSESSVILTIYEDLFHPYAVLTKQITKNETKIIEQNYIQIMCERIIETNWEDIESSYSIYGNNLICPKGNHFINLYLDSYVEIIPEDFYNTYNDWELICYYQPFENIMFQGILNSDTKYNFFFSNMEDSFVYLPIVDKLYDFLWTIKCTENHEYKMFCINLKESEIKLTEIIFYISYQHVHYNIRNRLFLDYNSKYSHAYFDHDTHIFYWMNANTTSEFSSGYSIDPVYVESTSVEEINILRNSISPFNFLYPNNTTIKKLNMIRNTRFIYYEIEYNKTNNIENYYGIIDIELNQIIFNTNETLIQFKPLKNNSMLAFTETNAYQICAIIFLIKYFII